MILACASDIFLLMSARSSFCDALRSAAAFSSLKNDLLDVNTSLTSLSNTFNLSFRSLTVLVSTVSSVLNLSCTSLRLCCSSSIASLFDVPVLESEFSALSIIFNCLAMYVSSLEILLLIISILCVTVSSARFCSRCALDRNPKIPMLVIKDNTTTAIVR